MTFLAGQSRNNQVREPKCPLMFGDSCNEYMHTFVLLVIIMIRAPPSFSRVLDPLLKLLRPTDVANILHHGTPEDEQDCQI